jgi:anti-sigma regulatory factor (Ser/Thr protein kinase)
METTLAPGSRRSARCGGYRFSAACVLPAIPASVPALRRHALRTARRWEAPEDTVEALALIVTELVTNAVRHSGSPEVTLLLCLAEGTLTVQVKDSGAWRPRTARPRDRDGDCVSAACGGRGLLLVEAYAANCAVRASSGGTTVTAEMVLPLPGPRSANP